MVHFHVHAIIAERLSARQLIVQYYLALRLYNYIYIYLSVTLWNAIYYIPGYGTFGISGYTHDASNGLVAIAVSSSS